MASVDGLTKQRMLQIEAESINAGLVDGNGNLILGRHDGSTLNAGNVRGPQGEDGPAGSAVDLTKPWNHAISYATGDVVGYAGRIFKAKRANLRKAPAFFGEDWDSVTAIDPNAWIERDPYFTSLNLNESHEIYWGGGTRTQSLTTVPGEFETGTQALKLTFGSNSNSWIYSHDENLVNDGEVVVARVRAKLQAASPGTLIRGLLTQNTPTDNPGPFEPGYSSAEGTGAQQLTTEWQTYTFVIPVNPGKPRARALILAEAWTNPATILIDYIKFDRSRKFMDRTTQSYIDSEISTVRTAMAPLASKVYVDNAVAAVPTYSPPIVTAYSPITPISNFNVAGRVTLETLENGKKRATINYQLTRGTSNFGAISTTSWTLLGTITPAGARFTPGITPYLTGWCSVLEGAQPINVYYDHAAGSVSVKGMPGHVTTLNIGHLITVNLVVIEA